MIILFLVFWGNSILFYTVAASIYIPTNSVQVYPFLHILSRICCLWSFWWQPFWQARGDSSWWFWFSFPKWLVMLSICSCACWPSVWLLQKNVYSWSSLTVQWLGPCASTAGDMSSIPGWGTKIPHAMRHGQKEEKCLFSSAHQEKVLSTALGLCCCARASSSCGETCCRAW